MVDYQFQECLTCWILLYGGLKPWLPFSVECRPLKVAAALPGSIRACPTAFTALRCRRCLNQWARSSGKLKEGIYTHISVTHIYLFNSNIYIYYIYIYRERAQTMPKSSEISKMDQFLLGFSLFANLSRGLLSFGLRHHRGPETPGWWIGGFHRKDPKRMISCYQSLLKIWAWHSLVVLYS